MPTQVPPAIKRRECDNCGTWFDVNPKVPLKRFCKDNCRKEFWQQGDQFRKFARYVDRKVPELVSAAFAKQRAELDQMRAEIQQERFLIQGMVARFERAHAADLVITQEVRRQSGTAA